MGKLEKAQKRAEKRHALEMKKYKEEARESLSIIFQLFLGNGAGILGNSITEMKATKQFKQPPNVWLLFLSLYIILCV